MELLILFVIISLKVGTSLLLVKENTCSNLFGSVWIFNPATKDCLSGKLKDR